VYPGMRMCENEPSYTNDGQARGESKGQVLLEQKKAGRSYEITATGSKEAVSRAVWHLRLRQRT